MSSLKTGAKPISSGQGLTHPFPWPAWILSLLLLSGGLAAWKILPTLQNGGTGVAFMLLFTILLTLALGSALSRSLARPARGYRLGYLLGLGLAWALVLSWVAARAPVQEPAGLIAAAWGGATLGALLLTSLRDGLWEDNFPPSTLIQSEVHRRHFEQIGSPSPTPLGKRLFDLLLSSLGLILSFPVTLLIGLLIWLEDPGPLLFVKNSVGKGGANFHQLKFRTMIRNAEEATGPVLAQEDDRRVLWIGRFLRKTALDELPQLVNILLGEMSFVGPRPQRTVLVHGYLETIPGYAERHRVAPGLSGLAQVAGSYYISPAEKLAWDRQYIRHASLGFDLRLIALAFLLVFWYRWKKNGDAPLPERWLGIRKKIN